MKAVTLHQPHASLLAEGVKPTETRTWPAPRSLWALDGSTEDLAIHAAKRPPRLEECPGSVSWPWVQQLPLGAVVAVMRTLDCGLVMEHDKDGCVLLAVPQPGERAEDMPRDRWVSGPVIDDLGDYSVGRWIWRPAWVHKIKPWPAKGGQRIWNWTSYAEAQR